MTRPDETAGKTGAETFRILPRLHLLVAAIAAASLLAGCDPLTRHKVLSTVFDGVPALPPPDTFCAERGFTPPTAPVKDDKTPGKQGAKQGSTHQPYVEKACASCHDKEKDDGLIRPKRELCFVCHAGFIKGDFVHGPVAVGDCLACHLPHTSQFSSLLKKPSAEICGACHREKRVASAMHDKVADRTMPCTDCHDPHAGGVHFFLK